MDNYSDRMERHIKSMGMDRYKTEQCQIRCKVFAVLAVIFFVAGVACCIYMKVMKSDIAILLGCLGYALIFAFIGCLLGWLNFFLAYKYKKEHSS